MTIFDDEDDTRYEEWLRKLKSNDFSLSEFKEKQEYDIGVMFASTRFLLDVLIEKMLLVEDTPEKDIEGEILCPICKTGVLKYYQSSYNGHRQLFCACIGCYCE